MLGHLISSSYKNEHNLLRYTRVCFVWVSSVTILLMQNESCYLQNVHLLWFYGPDQRYFSYSRVHYRVWGPQFRGFSSQLAFSLLVSKFSLDLCPPIRCTYLHLILSACPCEYICLTNCFTALAMLCTPFTFLKQQSFLCAGRNLFWCHVMVLHFHPRSFYCKTVSRLRAKWWYILSWLHFYVSGKNPWQP